MGWACAPHIMSDFPDDLHVLLLPPVQTFVPVTITAIFVVYHLQECSIHPIVSRLVLLHISIYYTEFWFTL
jgi:hypothetical protein